MTFRKTNVLYPLLFALLAIYYTLPFLYRYDYWGVRDWGLFTTIAAVPAGSIIHYSQFPFWNPYLGGGNILFHHPEVAVLSPFFPLYLIFGAVIGLKIQVLICYFLGFWGSHRLFCRLGVSPAASAMSSVAYFGSVHFVLHFAEGHIPFTHFCFLPWFVYFVLLSVEKRKQLAPAALALALMILGNGAAVPLLYTVTFSSLLFALMSLERRKLAYFRNLAVAAVAGAALAAVKSLPMVIYLVQNRWERGPEESIPLSALAGIFFGFNHSLYARNFADQYWSWHEYGAYISPILIIFALAALFHNLRKHKVWLVLLLFFLVLGLGNFGSLSPWALLSHLPGFSSARCSGRSFQFVILSAAVLGGFGFDYLREKLSSSCRWLKLTLPAAAGVVILTNLGFAVPIMMSAFNKKPEQVFRSPVFAHVIDDKPQAYKNYLANRGSLIAPWLSAYHPSRALVDENDKVLPDHVLIGKAEVMRRLYTPNRIEYELDAAEGGQIVIGMGYDVGWKASDKRSVYEKRGLIAFSFQPGRSQVSLSYRTPYFYTGLIISLATLVGLATLYRRS